MAMKTYETGHSAYAMFDQAVDLIKAAAHQAIEDADYFTAKRAITALVAITPPRQERYKPLKEL